MSTVEYAIGTIAEAAFAALLYKVVTGGAVTAALSISGVRPAILGANRARMTGLVVDAAAAVSASLGFSPAVAGSSA